MKSFTEEVLIAAFQGNKITSELVTSIMSKKMKEFTDKLSEAIIPAKSDLPLLAAAYKIMGESIYTALEQRDKTLCDKIVQRCTAITIMKAVDGEESE